MPMTPERWQVIAPILDEAFDLDPDSRSTFLERACAGDPELRAEVEALVVAERSAGSFLETPIQHSAADLIQPHGASTEEAASDGERIGPYRLIAKLGHGGMGAVYVAARADGHFEQRVALKMIRGGLMDDDVRRRFLQERQILAVLQHPDIARLFDGGVTPDGRPYFVMEYIEGFPITRYCDERRLGIEQRLRLFARVCVAVHYAHENQIVHCDLKPGNILVTTTGELKLLDFGIAKLLDAQADDATTPRRTGLHVMTPEYAAPEQIRGGPITAATDVYSLGVVLYELLTGHRPYRCRGRSPVTIERVVCEHEPLRPSTRVTRGEDLRHTDGRVETITPADVSEARDTAPDRLRRRLAGDLDQVVLRAMTKEPKRRYASVAALAEDLTRYLERRPVLARRGNTAYRARKFARRHRVGLGMAAFAALVFATASAFVVTRTVGTVDVPGASNRATASAAAWSLYEEGLRAYYQTDLHGARRLFRAALAEDSTLALAAYYALTTEFALALPRDTALEAQLRRAADRLPERERLLVRGRIAWAAWDPAMTAIAETLTTRYPDEPEGHLLHGRAQLLSGDLPGGLTHLRRVLNMDSLGLRGAAPCRACDAFGAMISAYISADSLPAAERAAREWAQVRPGAGAAWRALAQTLELQGRSEEALAAIRRVDPLEPGNPYVAIFPAFPEIRTGEFESADRLLREHARGGALDLRTEALWFLTISLRYQGRVREALTVARALRELRPEMPEPRMAEAQVLFEMGRHAEAAALFDSLAARPGHGEIGRLPSVLAQLRSWQMVHAADARAAAGDTAGLEVLADTIEALGARTITGSRQRLHHHVRGLLHAARGQREEAAREFYRATFWPGVPSSGFTRTNLELGRVLLALDRPDAAVRVLQPALRLGLEASAFYLTHTELHELLGQAFEAAGQKDSARAHYRWVVNAWKDADPAFQDRRAAVQRRLAALDR